MGNQHGKEQGIKGKYRKNPQWKSTAGPPHPPSRPELVTNPNIASDAVTIRWARPISDGGSPLQGYIVEHRRIGSQTWMRAVNMLIPNNELTISGLDPGWKYQFRVIAQNIVGVSEPSESSEPLTVMLQRNTTSTAPAFSTELHDKAVVENSSVEFQVSYQAIPVPEVVWFKDGFELLHSKHTKIHVSKEGGYSTLMIENVLPSDEGEIKCTATNRMGHAQTKAMLTVENPPKVILPKNYEEGLIAEAEEILRLKVSIEGRPPPTVIWSHNGSAINNGGRFEIFTTDRSSSLRIMNVQRSDRGEYQIKALNKIGEAYKAFLVTVTSRPDAPGKANITKCVGNTVTLTFTEPLDDGGCKIGNYIVEYFRVGWDVWLKATTSRGLTTTLYDLIEGSEYKFRVKAENPYGVSEPGEESYLLFIPDVKRGILQPVRSTSGRSSAMSGSVRSSLLSIPEEKRRHRSLTPEKIKVDSETSTRPARDESVEAKPRHKINVQFAPNIYDDAPAPAEIKSPPRSPKLNHIRFAEAPKAVFDNSGEPITTARTTSPTTNLRSMKNMENLSQADYQKIDNPSPTKLSLSEEPHEVLHNSTEFMIVLYPDRKEVKNENRDSFDFELDGLTVPPPPLSLSSPELNAEIPMQPPLRAAVSSTELLYERAMAKFYQAVAHEEAENEKNKSNVHEKPKKLPVMEYDDMERRKSTSDAGKSGQIITRMRLNSLQEEKRQHIKRRLSTETPENLLANMRQRSKDEDEPEITKSVDTPVITISAPTTPIEPNTVSKPLDHSPVKSVKIAEQVEILEKTEDYSSDYTDSTASSEDSIVGKMAALKERLSRIESDEDENEHKTYHPRSMDVRNVVSPYKSPEHGQAVNILSKPHPLPDPNFVPKPILKRPTSPTSSMSGNSFSSLPSSNPSSPIPPSSPTAKKRPFSPPPPKRAGSPLMKPPSPKQVEISSGTKKHLEERERSPNKITNGIKKFFDRIAISPRSSKENLKEIKQKHGLLDNEITVPINLERPVTPNIVTLSAFNEEPAPAPKLQEPLQVNNRNKKLVEVRQNSEEEIKTVIEHYTTIVRDRDSIRSKDKIPIYLNPEHIKKVQARAKQEGEDVESDEESNKQSIPQGKRELDLSALTCVTRSRSRDSSLSRNASRDTSLQRASQKPVSRDSSQTRDQFSATIYMATKETGAIPKQTRSRDNSVTRGRDFTSSQRGGSSRDSSISRRRDESIPRISAFQSNQSNKSESPVPFSKRTIRSTADDTFIANGHTRQNMPLSRSETASSISSQSRSKTPEELETEEKVKNNMSYAMDVSLLGFAFYLYIFKDAVFCIPILVLLVYRQIREAVQNNPLLKRKES